MIESLVIYIFIGCCFSWGMYHASKFYPKGSDEWSVCITSIGLCPLFWPIIFVMALAEYLYRITR